jgi:arabinogalactan oligomer/maltooligosaccharide transport system permease protein
MRNIISKIMTILVYLFLLLNALVVLGPVIWTVMSSLKPGTIFLVLVLLKYHLH